MPSTRTPRVPLTNWRLVEADRIYTTADVAGLLNCSVSSASRRLKAGTILSLPRLSETEGFRVLGVELLKVLGEQRLSLVAPSETATERQARAAASLDRVRRASHRK